MRTKMLVAVLALLICLGCGQTPPAAPETQDLEPIEGALTYHTPAYHMQLRQHLLKKARANDLQFLILQSFEPEVLLSIYESARGCEAELVEPEQQIWEKVVAKQGEVADIATKVLHKSLPEAIGTRLRALWKTMLLRTRYQDNPPTVLDGVSYVFLSDGSRGGEANNPIEGTRPFLFAEIGQLVVSYVEAEPAKEKDLLASLTKQMDALDALLAHADVAGAGRAQADKKK